MDAEQIRGDIDFASRESFHRERALRHWHPDEGVPVEESPTDYKTATIYLNEQSQWPWATVCFSTDRPEMADTAEEAAAIKCTEHGVAVDAATWVVDSPDGEESS